MVGHAIPWIAGAFATGFAGKAGADSWEAFRDGGWRGLRTFLAGIRRARTQEEGTVQIRAKGYPVVRFIESVPDEALEELGYLDWSTLTEGYLAWDHDARSWWQLRPGADSAEPVERIETHGHKGHKKGHTTAESGRPPAETESAN